MLACVHKMPAAFPFVIARVGRGFADFAKVPQKTTLMRDERARIPEEWEVEQRETTGMEVHRIVDWPMR